MGQKINQPFFTDDEIINSPTFPEMRMRLEHVHNLAHGYIGGTIGDSHTAFRDPFVFLIHSNVDRLFAAWQLRQGCEQRLDPKYVYGSESKSRSIGTPPEMTVGIIAKLSPWCGGDHSGADPTLKDVRPWASPDNWHKQPELFHLERENIVKTSLHISVVTPTKYDDMYDDDGKLRETKFNLCGSVFDLPELIFNQ